MKTSAAGRAFIRRHEGVRLQAYRDSVGVWTIGVGHTAAAGPPVPCAGMTITPQQCDDILTRDLARFEAEVGRLVKVPLQQNQFDALVSFHFNTGRLGSSTLLKVVNAGLHKDVAKELDKWTLAGGRRLAGLVRRRTEEAALYASGPAAVPPDAPVDGKRKALPTTTVDRAVTGTAGTVVAGATAAHQFGFASGMIAGVIVTVVVVGLIGFLIHRAMKGN
jgi:lysozyme